MIAGDLQIYRDLLARLEREGEPADLTACIGEPMARQLSNAGPFTRLTSRINRVGMTRTLSIRNQSARKLRIRWNPARELFSG